MAGEECSLNPSMIANRVLARDSNREAPYPSLPHQALTAQCAIVIHRGSGSNEGEGQVRRLLFARLKRRVRRACIFDVNQDVDELRSFPHLCGVSLTRLA